jgi:hypothetical protein
MFGYTVWNVGFICSTAAPTSQALTIAGMRPFG